MDIYIYIYTHTHTETHTSSSTGEILGEDGFVLAREEGLGLELPDIYI